MLRLGMGDIMVSTVLPTAGAGIKVAHMLWGHTMALPLPCTVCCQVLLQRLEVRGGAGPCCCCAAGGQHSQAAALQLCWHGRLHALKADGVLQAAQVEAGTTAAGRNTLVPRPGCIARCEAGRTAGGQGERKETAMERVCVAAS